MDKKCSFTAKFKSLEEVTRMLYLFKFNLVPALFKKRSNNIFEQRLGFCCVRR